VDVLDMALQAVPADHKGTEHHEKEARHHKDHDHAKHHKHGKDSDHHNKDLKNLYTGVELTKKELLKTLERYDIKCYDPMGEEFDFNKHDAVFQSPIQGKKAGTIFHVSKKGFTIKDRVLRPASVGVVKEQQE
jgi:molecular chaperone GrpE (heat shock protein)